MVAIFDWHSVPSRKCRSYQETSAPQRKRELDWKEVVRPVSDQENDERNARMSKYPEIVEQGAAYDQGMSKQTQVYAVADGGNGYAKRCK